MDKELQEKLRKINMPVDHSDIDNKAGMLVSEHIKERFYPHLDASRCGFIYRAHKAVLDYLQGKE